MNTKYNINRLKLSLNIMKMTWRCSIIQSTLNIAFGNTFLKSPEHNVSYQLIDLKPLNQTGIF